MPKKHKIPTAPDVVRTQTNFPVGTNRRRLRRLRTEQPSPAPLNGLDGVAVLHVSLPAAQQSRTHADTHERRSTPQQQQNHKIIRHQKHNHKPHNSKTETTRRNKANTEQKKKQRKQKNRKKAHTKEGHHKKQTTKKKSMQR